MAKRTRKKLDQYLNGTGNTGLGANYIPSPAEVLQKDKQNKAQAIYDASTNPLVMGTGIAGGVGMAAGMHFGGGQMLKGLMDQIQFANGGVVGQTEVEVEGNEIAETPMGDLMQFDGPSHEQGGIDATLPVGTKIFSDRIAVDGKTMQQRKAKREKLIKKLTKAGDTAADQNTLKRTQQFLDKEEKQDLMIQQVANMNSDPKKFAYGSNLFGIGDPPDDIFWKDAQGNPVLNTAPLPKMSIPVAASKPLTMAGYTPTVAKPIPQEEEYSDAGGYSTGDLLGIAGHIGGALSPLLGVQEARANTAPNINAFENYGQEGLEVMDSMKNYIGSQQDNALNRVALNKTANQKARRNGARGINQMRALDIATEQEASLAENNIYDTFSRQMMGILGQEAQMENIQDQVVMGGEAQRDLADRQDLGAHLTNKGAAMANLFTQIQGLGKIMNVGEQRQEMMDLMPDLNKYGMGYVKDKKGKLVQKKVKK